MLGLAALVARASGCAFPNVHAIRLASGPAAATGKPMKVCELGEHHALNILRFKFPYWSKPLSGSLPTVGGTMKNIHLRFSRSRQLRQALKRLPRVVKHSVKWLCVPGIAEPDTRFFNSAAPSAQVAGTVTAWGYNLSGQTNVPVGLSNVVAVAGGRSHSIGLRADGTVASWGSSGGTTVPGLEQRGCRGGGERFHSGVAV